MSNCRQKKIRKMTGLLLQLQRLTFLPRRGRCIVSLSCDPAITFCYPGKRQLTGLGCRKAASLPERCCAAVQTVFGQEEAQRVLAPAGFQTLPGAGAVGCSAVKRGQRLQEQVLPPAEVPFRDHSSQRVVIQPGMMGS